MTSLSPNSFRVIAHRGASIRAPENTASAFRLAWDAGAREFECDVQRTREGRLVLCHDLQLTRYGHPGLMAEECTWKALRILDMGSWFAPEFQNERMMLLEELLFSYADRVFYHLEIKGNDPLLPAALYEQVKQSRLEQSVLFTSFSLEQLKRLRICSTESRIGWLVPRINDAVLEQARALDMFQICPKADTVTPDSVRQALQVVKEVRCWGCPGEATAARQITQQIRAAGCCGITVDEPLWLL